MNYRYFNILLILVFLILTGCNKEVTGDEKTAADYVKAKGYKISSFDGDIEKYTLNKEKLVYGKTETIPYRQTWAVQQAEPDAYFGKEISIYKFTVTNHPLEKQYKKNAINVYVMLANSKVIGGTSFPAPVDGLIQKGAPYSLDGKTLEEVTGMTFQEWSEKWKQKYGT